MNQQELMQILLTTMESVNVLRRELTSSRAIANGIYKSIADSSPEMREIMQVGFNNALDFVETVSEEHNNQMEEILKEILLMKEFILGPPEHRHGV